MMSLFIFLVFLREICDAADVNNTANVIQDSGVRRAKAGEDVIFNCSFKGATVTFLSWYQQSLGGKPHIISTRMRHAAEAEIYGTYKERFRVSAQNQEGKNDLTIAGVRPSDSATYFCGILQFNAIEFGEGIFLHIQPSLTNIQAVVHQPASEPFRQGDSLNLSCTVYAESQCAEEQNLYWLRHEASQTAFMAGAAQCNSPAGETPRIKNCTSSLAITSATSSDTGMYYCALASCGEIVFGNGTRVEIVDPPVLVYCLSVATAFSISVLLVLAFVMYKLKKNLCSVCKGTISHQTSPAAPGTTSQDANSLHYAALSLNKNRTQHRHNPENIQTECVYSGVKSRRE